MAEDYRAQAEANKEIMRRVMAALGEGGGDANVINQYVHEDCILVLGARHPTGGGTYKGPVEMRKAREAEFVGLGVKRVEVKEIIADGPSTVVLLIEFHGLDGDGKPWSMPIADVFYLRDGKIVEIQPYFKDTALLADYVAKDFVPHK